MLTLFHNRQCRRQQQTGDKGIPMCLSCLGRRHTKKQCKLGGDTFQCIQSLRCSSPFHSSWTRLLYCCEWVTSPLHNKPVYFPSLARYPLVHPSGAEQMRIKCLAQVHNTGNMIWPCAVSIQEPSALYASTALYMPWCLFMYNLG